MVVYIILLYMYIMNILCLTDTGPGNTEPMHVTEDSDDTGDDMSSNASPDFSPESTLDQSSATEQDGQRLAIRLVHVVLSRKKLRGKSSIHTCTHPLTFSPSLSALIFKGTPYSFFE